MSVLAIPAANKVARTMKARSASLVIPAASKFARSRDLVPSDISALAAWYRADAANVTIATGVSQWNDLSGAGLHLTQGTGASQPTWLSSDINGRPSIQFNGSSHFLSRAATTLGVTTAGYTALLVVKEDTAAATGIQVALAEAAGTSGFYLWQITPNKAVRHVTVGDGTGPAVQTATYESRTYNFATGAGPVLRVNRQAQTVSGAPTTLVAPVGASILCLGSRTAGADFWAACRIAELAIWPRPLQAAEITILDTYVTSRYGL